uniref:TIR domain-containing protein n=2 Tax=Quercus lobata TaxID=97700 RepID=A0A7N2LHW1_QUELO
MSKISIVVLSENYASSTWCLDELDYILKRKKKGQFVLPVFYEVEPSEVRKQEQKFGDNLSKHAEKFKDKVQNWKAALNKVGRLSGCHYKGGSETKFIREIIEEISKFKIMGKLLYVAKYPVGVDSRAKDVESLVDIKSDYVHMVGIHGLGGIGKTTIAKAVYNKIVGNFERSCFLANVRENSRTDDDTIKLQEKILSKILQNQHLKVNNVSEGINVIKERLRSKRVLLVLDDVDKSKQIENLLAKHDWLVSGSRVIITTRDEHLLIALGKVCTTYKVKKLDNHEALDLFSQYAFHKVKPDEEYSKLTNQALYYAKGLPLALEIIGSNLCGETKPVWESTLRKYEKYPDERINEILEVSYDGLGENEKNIFLDISCFFKGRSKDFVENILDKCNLYPKSGIQILVHKSLITIDQYGKLSMHDLIQQMGMEIVRQESPNIPRKRSRLCNYKDALQFLLGNTGSEEIRGIMLYSPTLKQVRLHPEAFKMMENLIFLMVDNVEISEALTYLPSGLRLLEWPKYPFNFPSNYCPQQLVALEMRGSCIRLEKIFKQEDLYENIKSINLSECEFIRKLPGFRAPNLETLNLGGCVNLTEVHDNIGLLDKLEYWELGFCKKLEILPSKLNLKSLWNLNLHGCKRLKKFPQIHPEMKCLILYLGDTRISKLPSSLKYLTRGLIGLHLNDVQNLDLSFAQYGFKSLTYLDLSSFDGNMVDLYIWLRPDYLPVLATLLLYFQTSESH